MGNLGAGEIVFIAIFALLVFGPKKLPDIARQVGRALSEFKKAANEFKEELDLTADYKPQPKPPTELRPGPRG